MESKCNNMHGERIKRDVVCLLRGTDWVFNNK